jgi:alkaline phosphatase D
MKRTDLLPLLLSFLLFNCQTHDSADNVDLYCLPVLVGEVTESSAIIQARITASDTLIYNDIHDADTIFFTDLQGKSGMARFIISADPLFKNPVKTAWLVASPDQDYIVKKRINGLRPDQHYYYRVEYGEDTKKTKITGTNTFKTFPEKNVKKNIEFVMVTGSHFDRFYLGGGFGKPSSQGKESYLEEDKYEGFPGFETISDINPDFFIGNGDNVYYDHPPQNLSKTREELRAKWHRQFFMPRARKMFSHVPTFWLKDDHDHRFDDSDTTEVHLRYGAEPSHELGKNTFIEQVPVADPDDQQIKTYRSIRAGQLLQLWLMEARDYRSPNHIPDNEEKSMWGKEQLDWLMKSLLESDATFKILVSPTPMIGPDDARKTDNHTNVGGFSTEGEAFFKWLAENDFLEKNFYIICGDRHWKYHSVRPDGFEEFSCGALVDQNSRIGRAPGDPNSTDPKGRIKQPYSDTAPSGGFLHVKASTEAQGDESIVFTLFDPHGKELYSHKKIAK